MTKSAGDPWVRAMLAGDFEAAWRRTDELEAARRAGAPAPDNLRWDGSDFAGRRVLVRCLHGLGDTLQFARFVPLVAKRAKRLHFLVQPMLLDLLTGAPGLGEVSNAWTDEPPPCDVEIEVMELAYALRARAECLPPPYPSLRARVAGRLRHELPPRDRLHGLRVGLLWAASDWDPKRSLPLRTLAPLLATQGARFFGLQQGEPARDTLASHLGIEPLWQHTGQIVDAAAAMVEMDLVICVDGMPAHLAGTLGVPTWLLLKHDADWRWMRGRCDTPWYPRMRLFRQPQAGNWEAVVTDITRCLQAMARVRSPASPASSRQCAR